MLRSKKGQGGISVIMGILLVVVGVAMVLVGIFISQELNTTINETMLSNAGWNTSSAITAANATPGMTAAWSAYANVQSAFTLCGISFIVIGAAMIITILKSAF